jgi:cytochrome c biogenesis protein CcmG/thiol:disulfide interchange protein DsbE
VSGKRAPRRSRSARSTTATWAWIGGGVVVAVIVAMLAAGGRGGGFEPSPPGSVTIDQAREGPLAAGEVVPAFSAPAIDGSTVRWTGRPERPTVLAVWASWCPHCQAELPRLAAALDRHPGVDLVTVVTAIGQRPGPTPPEYLASEGLSFPVAVDDASGTLARGLGVQGFPTVYYVGADGRVVGVTVGEVDAAQLEAMLEALEA